jgi:hypothetical protein
MIPKLSYIIILKLLFFAYFLPKMKHRDEDAIKCLVVVGLLEEATDALKRLIRVTCGVSGSRERELREGMKYERALCEERFAQPEERKKAREKSSRATKDKDEVSIQVTERRREKAKATSDVKSAMGFIKKPEKIVIRDAFNTAKADAIAHAATKNRDLWSWAWYLFEGSSDKVSAKPSPLTSEMKKVIAAFENLEKMFKHYEETEKKLEKNLVRLKKRLADELQEFERAVSHKQHCFRLRCDRLKMPHSTTTAELDNVERILRCRKLGLEDTATNKQCDRKEQEIADQRSRERCRTCFENRNMMFSSVNQCPECGDDVCGRCY